ncbi:acyl-CoA desaturase, partial [Sesbania bispinosa]
MASSRCRSSGISVLISLLVSVCVVLRATVPMLLMSGYCCFAACQRPCGMCQSSCTVCQHTMLIASDA